LKVSLLIPAQQELDEAFAWYESQAVGLGYGFLDEFNQAVRLVATFPSLYQPINPGIRRCLLNRFPYGLVYGVDDEMIVIVAVAHVRRQPNYWFDRLSTK
jgi:plasmid stabilization system protein ParE